MTLHFDPYSEQSTLRLFGVVKVSGEFPLVSVSQTDDLKMCSQ